jgi:catechol 2,3-dioxygenase-like lactoylglutathione lyase family enzyme
MMMFSHIMVGATDLNESKKFYDTVLGTLGVPPGNMDDKGRVFYMTKTGIFAISKPINGEPACPAQADAWHAAGVANGGTTCEDPPGVREGAMGKLYLAYLRDPSGNKLCALNRM